MVMPPPVILDAPESIPPIPEGSNLPALREPSWPVWLSRTMKGGGAALLALFMIWFLLDRQDITREHPYMEGFYNAIGLHIFHVGEGLVIEGVRSELRYEDGITRLTVLGRLHNTTEKAQQTPAIVAKAMGSDGSVMQSWQIDPPTATLAPDELVPFQSAINAPKGTVVEINLNFVEPPHDSQ